MEKDKFKIIKDLQENFPQKFIEDFARTTKLVHGGPNSEAIEDHLKIVHGLSNEDILEIQAFLKKQEAREYSLCETVADIAFIAGEHKFYGGDSREDISNFILWAKEFEYINRGVNWGEDVDRDYIDEICSFAEKKIKEHKK